MMLKKSFLITHSERDFGQNLAIDREGSVVYVYI